MTCWQDPNCSILWCGVHDTAPDWVEGRGSVCPLGGAFGEAPPEGTVWAHAALHEVRTQVSRLLARQEDHLRQIARLSQSVPLDSEIATAIATRGVLLAEVGSLRARVQELERLINTPRTDDFVEAVKTEAAHQVERWGVEHDAGKRPEDWMTLMLYLLGKAARAHFDGNREKLLHHIVTGAAVLFNWWRREMGVEVTMRPGVGER